MKKKILSILLMVVLLIGLTGCGESKETMLEKSTKLSVKHLKKDLYENFKIAKEKYEGNVYEISAGVISVEEKFVKIELHNIDVDREYLEVYFEEEEDLYKIKANQKITFVGKITDITKNNDKNIEIKIKNAYYISDIIEVSGEFKSYGSSVCSFYLYDYYNENDRDNYTVYELDEIVEYTTCRNPKINGIEINYGDKITIKGKAIETDNQSGYDDNWTITEFESIKVDE